MRSLAVMLGNQHIIAYVIEAYLESLHICLHPFEVTHKIVHHVIHLLLSKSSVRIQRRVWNKHRIRVIEIRLERKVSSNDVGRWIRQHEVGETTALHFSIVGKVSPSSDTTLWIKVGEERRPVNISGILGKRSR